jgi:hypothetical protein
MAILIRTDGTVLDVDGRVTRESAPALLSGALIVYRALLDGHFLLMDLEGGMNNKPLNNMAVAMLRDSEHRDINVYGSVLVLDGHEHRRYTQEPLVYALVAHR